MYCKRNAKEDKGTSKKVSFNLDSELPLVKTQPCLKVF